MTRRTALVTGGSRGIGAEIARRLAADGCRVAITYRARAEAAAEVVAGIRSADGEAVAIAMDQTRRSDIAAAAAEVRARFGAIDILVNNAAIAQEKPFAEITDADFDAMLGCNLRGPFACCQEVLPGMQERGWGRIINLTSIGGQWGGINQVHYALSKAGVICLTRSLAKIYSRHGITTNAVAPGLVATEMTAGELGSAAGQAKVAAIPSGRIGSGAEIAATVAFLASDGAGYLTGQTLNPNGGMLFA